jgi:hypothetical protein
METVEFWQAGDKNKVWFENILYRDFEESDIVGFHVPSVRTVRCFQKYANAEYAF